MCRSVSGVRGRRSHRRRLGALAVVCCVWALPVADPLPAQTEACAGVVGDPRRLTELLPQVPKYLATYVLVFPDRLAGQMQSTPPVLEGLRVAFYDDSVAEAKAAALGVTAATRVTFEASDAGRIVRDVLSGQVDVGLLWAPLAGLLVQELDLDYELSLLSFGEPSAAPAVLRTPVSTAPEDPVPCAVEVSGLLEGYGVVPAEKLVPLDIRTLLDRRPPPRSEAQARAGAELYAAACAKCHGAEAVAATDALAPVDLLVSTPRFSYPGFLYIVLNGRPENGMPGFRGTLSEPEVELVYQYARERAHGTLRPSTAASDLASEEAQ